MIRSQWSKAVGVLEGIRPASKDPAFKEWLRDYLLAVTAIWTFW